VNGPARAIVEERESDRRNSFRTDRPDEVIRGELLRAGFPFVINGSLLEPPYTVSRMGYADDPRMGRACAQLEEKRDPEGRYILDWHPQGYYKPGSKGQPSKWATLYAHLALKHRENE